MMEEQQPQDGKVIIRVLNNGPYRVEGPVTIVDAEGREFDLTGKARISLCRCGASSNKPFCDGTHSKIGFIGAEIAARIADQRNAEG